MTRRDRPTGALFTRNPKLKLLDQCREALRFCEGRLRANVLKGDQVLDSFW